MTEPVPFSSVQHSEEPDSTVTSHPEGRNQQNGCTLATYAEAKRLPTALLTYLGVSDTLYYGKPALQMPYCDGDGVEQAVRLRIGLEKCEGSDDRFRWRLGGKIGLYGLPQLRPGKDVTLVEGESDTHTLIHHGVNVVGVPGAGSWNEVRDAVHLQSFDTIYAVIEPDAGGAALLKSLRESVLRDRVRIIRLTGFEDVSDMHVDNPERFQERWNEAVNASVPLDMLMSEDAEDHELAFYPFEMTRDGLFVEVPRGKTIQRRFLSAPFEVCGRCRDPNGNDWGRLLRFKDDDGDEHEHVVTDAALHGDRGVLCSDLAAQGLRLATVASDRSQFVRYLNEVRTHTRVTRLQRTGWHVVKGQPVFVHPTGALGAPTGEIVRFEGGPQSPYAHAGTLEEWQSSVGALIGRHSRLVLLCSAAFAGPLLYLIGHEGGGIHVHGESTTGKTTAVRAAASVWGKGGTPGYVLPWRQTANAFEAILSGRTDTLVAYDEIGVGEAKAISAAMYQITAGTGKARLNRNARLREAMTWRGMLLSTGEVPVGTKIAEERGGRAYAGQQVRVLDLSADVGSGCGIFDADGLDENAGDLADRITSAASQHYGVAGLAFVRQLLVDGPEEVGALVAEMITAFEQAHLPANANGQVRRAARLLGLIGAAGELAAKWDVVPWQEGRSFDAAAKALADWTAQRGGLGAAEVHDGLEQVRTYMAMYGESRFDATDDADGRTATTRAGWRRGSGESRQWLILPPSWRDEICRGHNPQTIVRALAERGMLLRDSEGRFQRSERTPLGQRRVYVVTASILEADNDDS